MVSQVVILVGGAGTRLGKLTSNTPKPMLEVNGKPFLDILIKNFLRHGFKEFLLLAGFQGEKIRDYYSKNTIDGADISVLIEPQPLGTAGCLKFAKQELHNEFFLTNGDTYFDINYLALIDGGLNGAVAKIGLLETQDRSRFGAINLDENGYVADFSEKEKNENLHSGFINAGVYYVQKNIVDFIGGYPCSLEQDVFPVLIKQKCLLGKSFSNYFIDFGIPETFQKIQSELKHVEKRPAVFFDRDGTLNEDNGYTHKVEDLVWIEGAREAIRHCNDKGYYVFVVTNQAGIARGYYDVNTVTSFHKFMQKQLRIIGAHIDAFEFCPHHTKGKVPEYSLQCNCRKPETGMLQALANAWPICLEKSLMIGDKESDYEAAKRFGIEGFQYHEGSLYNFVKGYIQ